MFGIVCKWLELVRVDNYIRGLCTTCEARCVEYIKDHAQQFACNINVILYCFLLERPLCYHISCNLWKLVMHPIHFSRNCITLTAGKSVWLVSLTLAWHAMGCFPIVGMDYIIETVGCCGVIHLQANSLCILLLSRYCNLGESFTSVCCSYLLYSLCSSSRVIISEYCGCGLGSRSSGWSLLSPM